MSRRLAGVGSAVFVIAAAFWTGRTTAPPGPTVPAVVDHAYVDPSEYFYTRTVEAFPKAVFKVESSAKRWCDEYRDICSGVVRQPEAAYIGLTRDHDATIRMLRKTLDLPDPAMLRAFRAPYSESELRPLGREIRELVETQFPGEIGCFGEPDPGEPPCRPDGVWIYQPFPALGRQLVDVPPDAPDELLRVLHDKFGEKIFFRSNIAYQQYAEPLTR